MLKFPQNSRSLSEFLFFDSNFSNFISFVWISVFFRHYLRVNSFFLHFFIRPHSLTDWQTCRQTTFVSCTYLYPIVCLCVCVFNVVTQINKYWYMTDTWKSVRTQNSEPAIYFRQSRIYFRTHSRCFPENFQLASTPRRLYIYMYTTSGIVSASVGSLKRSVISLPLNANPRFATIPSRKTFSSVSLSNPRRSLLFSSRSFTFRMRNVYICDLLASPRRSHIPDEIPNHLNFHFVASLNSYRRR